MYFPASGKRGLRPGALGWARTTPFPWGHLGRPGRAAPHAAQTPPEAAILSQGVWAKRVLRLLPSACTHRPWPPAPSPQPEGGKKGASTSPDTREQHAHARRLCGAHAGQPPSARTSPLPTACPEGARKDPGRNMAPAPELEAPSQRVLPSKGRSVHLGQSPINILNALFRPHTLLNRIITLVTAEPHPQSGKSHCGSVFRAGTGSVKLVNRFISLDTTSHRGRQDELAQGTDFCKQTRQARAERLTGWCLAEETQSTRKEIPQTRGLSSCAPAEGIHPRPPHTHPVI